MLRTSRFFKRVSLCVAWVSFLANSALAGDADPYWEGRKWEAWTEIGGYAANRSYARRGELALWSPFMQDRDSLFFLDLRGKLFAEDQEEGNAAIGYRFMRNDGWNPGIWIGLDRRNTESGTNFDQASFGAELLSEDWDFRVNGYAPLNDRELVASSEAAPTVEVIGSSIFLIPGDVTDEYEIAMWGVDAEVGWRVPLERFGYDPTWGLGLKDADAAGPGRHHELRLYAGGFYFDHADFDGEVAGPRARAEWRIGNIFEDWDGSRLTFEAAWQHDDVREHQVEGGVRLRIPFGGGADGGLPRHALNAQERRMTEGLKRDTDIVSQSQTVVTEMGGGEPEPVEDALSGVALNSVIFVENGGCLCDVLVDAGGNVLVIADGGDADYEFIWILENQTLLGGGGSLLVRGRTSGTVATYTAPGTRPTISDPFEAVVMEDHAHLSGVIVSGAPLIDDFGEFGVVAEGSAAYVSNTEISNFLIGFSLLGEGSATIRNSIIEYAGVGIHAPDGGTLDIRNSILRSTPADIPDLFDVPDFQGIGVAMTGTLTLANTTFEGDPNALLYFGSGDSTVTEGSTGNSHSLDSGQECWLQNAIGPNPPGSFTGTIIFSSPSATITRFDCGSFDILID